MEKSKLLFQDLYPALKNYLAGKDLPNAPHIIGMEKIMQVVHLSRSLPNTYRRTCVANYLGILPLVYHLFSLTSLSRLRGYHARRFYSKEGKCEKCRGMGFQWMSVSILEKQKIICTQCKGNRYNAATLEITYKNKNIAEVLDMNIEESVLFFQSTSSIGQKLINATKVGLSYIPLHQSLSDLSGGELQRLQLAKVLYQKSKQHTLYILDEPSRGLHMADIATLLPLLHQLRDRGNSVWIIEHHLDILANVDWIVDLFWKDEQVWYKEHLSVFPSTNTLLPHTR